MNKSDRPTLVVLGTGFAAYSLIKTIDVDRYDVAIISPRNHFLFTPLLPSTTVGTLEFRSIIEPIRIARKGTRYYQASCNSIDVENKKLHCTGAFKNTPFDLDYDYLLIAVGAVSNTFGVPGVEEHAFRLKELADARNIRQRISECFERACKPGRAEEEIDALLHFVVVGGGPTGVEFAAEMQDFVRQDISRWFPDLAGRSKITLLEARGAILTQFDARLGQYAIDHFAKTRINIQTDSPVQEVRESSVLLSSGEEIHCGLVVWSTGIGPTEFVQSLPYEKDDFSRLLVDAQFHVSGSDDIFAAGDCAAIVGEDHPPTAQVAQQQGTYLAKMLNRIARDQPLKEFKYRHMGMMAYIGERRALADLKNVKGRGFMVWLFWRSAYLSKLISLKNKILVLQDWIRTSIFGRDISHF